MMWIGNDGDNAGGQAPRATILVISGKGEGRHGIRHDSHNSHLGPGAIPPTVHENECLLADGHKVVAFPSATMSQGVYLFPVNRR